LGKLSIRPTRMQKLHVVFEPASPLLRLEGKEKER